MSESMDVPDAAMLDKLRKRLQERILSACPPRADVKAEDVWRLIKRWLLEAYQDDVLMNPADEIHRHVPKPVLNGDEVMIYGGLIGSRGDEKDFKRLPSSARLKRSDGAWLHFSLSLKLDKQGHVSDMHAYSFELVFPDGHQPRFVRFDLNEKDHENDNRWIRCHLHPGNDDLMLPAPVMSPEELLDVLLRRLRSRDASRPRA